jgi:hypothetical protein
MFSDDALQVQFADSLKQRKPAAVNVLSIFQRSIGRPCQQPPKFLFAVQQSLTVNDCSDVRQGNWSQVPSAFRHF